MSLVALVSTDKGDHMDGLARHVQGLEGPVVVLSFVRPHATLRQQLRDRNVPTDDLVVLDTTTGGQDDFTAGVYHVDAPTKLERIMASAKQLLGRKATAAHLVLDTYPFLVTYNGRRAALEFCHQIATWCRNNDHSFHIMGGGDVEELHTIVDDRIDLA